MEKGRGRKILYSVEIAGLICFGIANGKSLRELCDQEGYPSRGTVFRWLLDQDKQTFRDQYEHARTLQLQGWADEVVSVTNLKEGEEDSTVKVARARLQHDARKWVLSKLLPKKYGDHPDGPSEAPAAAPDLSRLSLEEREQLLQLKRKMAGHA